MSKSELLELVDSTEFRGAVAAAYKEAWKYPEDARVAAAIAMAFRKIAEASEAY